MGNVITTKVNEEGFPPLLEETQIFALWTIHDAKELLKRFNTLVHGYSLVEAQFETILSFKPSVKDYIDLEELFDILDNDHDGRIDGLELLGGVCLCCQATFEEKARFCFELFDFNLNSFLSKKEMIMMMMSTICGIIVLTGGTEEMEPELEAIEALATDAFIRADRSGDGQISFEEFVFWARSNRVLMAGLETLSRIAFEAKASIQSDDSAPEMSDTEETKSPTKSSKVVSQTKEITIELAAPQGGDEAQAVVPWLSQIMEPTNFKMKKSNTQGPSTNLELAWVFGYRAQGNSGRVRYLRSLSSPSLYIMYTAASVCVIYDMINKSQRFYLGHTCEVTAVCIHSNEQIVATADIKCNIHIWTLDSSSQPVSLVVFPSIGKGGIQLLCFSPRGDRIASVGLDTDQTVCIHDANNGKLISSAKGMSHPAMVYDMAYSQSGGELALAGKNQIKFFVGVDGQKRAIDSKVGRIGSNGKRQPFCSVAYIKDEAIVGCASGELYRFKDGVCIAMIKAHGVNEAVFSLYYNKENGTLLSGGKDGLIKTWDSTLKEVGQAINLTKDLNGSGNIILSMHQIADQILIATKGSDIFQVTLPLNPTQQHTMTRIAWGHFAGELWGLALHPTEEEFCTVGEDKTIRIWSLTTHEQINVSPLPAASRAVAYSYSGKILCIGMVDGSMNLLDHDWTSLKIYSTWKHSNKIINDIKFSPNDNIIAAASADTNIYIYKKNSDNKTFTRQAVCRGHSGGVTHIDFSMDSLYLQSNGTDYSLLFWDASGNQVKHSSKMRDTVWATFTCVLGWPVQGVHQSGDITDVNACMALPDVEDIIVGDDFGKVCLYKYPAISRAPIHQTYSGHASHVTCVRFTTNRQYALSTGGRDKTILLWKHSIELEDSDQDNQNSSSSATSGNEAARIAVRKDHPEVPPRSLQQEAANLGWTVQELKEFANSRSNTKKKSHAEHTPPSGGDESSNVVLPWKSSVIEPTKWTATNSSTDVDLKLEWVYGHRSHDCRNNVLYSADGSVVFNAANLAIVYHKPSGKQQFLYGSHVDEVISIAAHPVGQIFATGAAGRTASVVVWSSNNMSVLSKLENIHSRGVSLLAFNPLGNLLASIGLDENNSFSIHDWTKNILILNTPTNANRILSCCFMASNTNGVDESEIDSSNIVGKRDVFVTAGKGFLKFWWWYGQNVSSQAAMWGSHTKERKSTILCLSSVHPDILVSASSAGNLLIWRNYKIINHVKEFMEKNVNGIDALDFTNSIVDASFFPKSGYPHKSSILAMHAVHGQISEINDVQDCLENYDSANRLITGDRDGVICVWRLVKLLFGTDEEVMTLILLKTFKMQDFKPVPAGTSVKSICERDGVILIGTSSSEIIEVLDESISCIIRHVDSPKSKFSRALSLRINVADALNNTIPASFLSSNHCAQEIWGLTCHPFLPVFFTTGDDHSIKCWSLTTNKLLSYITLSDKVRTVDILPTDGQHIAMGSSNGAVHIFPTDWFLNPDGKTTSKNGIDMQLLARDVSSKWEENRNKAVQLTHSTEWVKVLKYSFEASLLASGHQDNKIHVFDVNNAYQHLYTVKHHGGIPLHIDFGVMLKVNELIGTEELVKQEVKVANIVQTVTEIYDHSTTKIEKQVFETTTRLPSNESLTVNKEKSTRALGLSDICVQSSSKSGELLFWKAEDGSRINGLTAIKDAWWATFTSCYGWAVQGVWNPSEADQDIKIFSVARSHTFEQVPAVATVDNYGRLRLFNYPCVQPGAADKCYRGHTGIITDVKFSFDDKYCITTGGTDRCVFVWSTDIEDEIRERIAISTIQNFKSIGYVATNEVTNDADDMIIEDLEDDSFNIKKMVPTAGDEFGAIKPWKGSIREPTTWKDTPDIGQIPAASLELRYVHGYRGWDCRSNIGFADDAHEIVYHVAGVGIVLNINDHKQVLNTEHDDDILSLAVHPEGHTVATGEIGKFPKIVLWDANTGVTLRTIMHHKKGVTNLLFSLDGEQLISIGMDEDRTVAVHNTKTGNLLGKGKVGKGIDVYCMSVSSNFFLIGGKNYMKFWDLPAKTSSGGELPSKTGLYYLKTVKVRTATACTCVGADGLSGMIDGTLLLWKERSNTKCIAQAHTGAITVMHCVTPANGLRDAGQRFLSGGKDGFVHMWDMQLNKLWTLNMNETTPLSAGPQIQALAARQNRLLIGTKAAEIYEVTLSGASEAIVHVQGHNAERGEVWGLAVHPKMDRMFVTCGDDMTVRLWDAKLCKLIKVMSIGAKARAVAYHPDGSQIAVALMDGKVLILSEDLSNILNTIIISSAWIQVLTFSPNGQYLAVGSHDSLIHILETKSYSCKAKCKGHHSFITAVDFSANSDVLQSVSGDYDLLFWKVQNGQQIKSPTEVRDVTWASTTCTLGWAVQGIWPPEADGTDINSVGRNPSHLNLPALLVTGDDFRQVKLFTYPSCKERAQYRAYKGHSEHVMNVKFSADGRRVFSVGGLDKAVMQFDVIYP